MSSQLLRNTRKNYNLFCNIILRHYTSELFEASDAEDLKKRVFRLSKMIKELT